ncbi:YxeA family protein [Paenisporosarcina sp. OV554]|uniref:YxeA family protein n=1 Tax=Paenisporosarcina sp. OV554 TaxID=2135694 RepID=UPI000D393557|nr:YxeA family protein [Paenisporosarcina sp. OV554]PUB08334.1 uncharacterized protein (TIGR01655 family) [Paenisporosarcina sp. OV554]
MKRLVFILLGVFLVSIISLGIAEKNDLFGIKKWGSESYYVQINEDGIAKTTKGDNGEKSTRYYYKMNAYNTDGNTIPVEFSANKELKLNAFLLVDVNDTDKKEHNTISSYKEVAEKELPEKVKKQLNIKN